MMNIVVARRAALNAHFCRCLAHFYRLLEKTDKSAHYVRVENDNEMVPHEP